LIALIVPDQGGPQRGGSMSLKEWWRRRTRFTDAHAARWESTRERGRRRFVIVEGVLRFGLSVAVLQALTSHLLGSPGPPFGHLALNLVLFPLAGIWFGGRVWADNERRYADWRRGFGRTHATTAG
jgi:hypothetical protein